MLPLLVFSSAAPAFAAQAPTSLVVGMTSAPDVTDLNPMRNIITYYVASTWLSMIGWDSNGNTVPGLARSWTTSTNGTVFTFYLKDGLKWSDGQPITAADVNFTAYVVAQQGSFWNFFFLGPIMVPDSSTTTGYTIAPGAITMPNSTTVVFHLPSPSATFLTEGPGVLWILPQHVYKGFNFNSANPDLSTLVGSGAFIPRSYTPGSELDEVANPNYMGGAPHFSTLVFKYYQSSTAAELALESGSINVLEAVPPTDAQALSKTPGITISTQEDQSNIYLIFNMSPNLADNSSNPVSNLLVRRAIAMAIDMNGVLNSSLGAGNYKLANQIEVPNMRYNGQPVQNSSIPSPEYPYNLTAAAQLLDQAGYPAGAGGVRFTLNLVAQSGGIGNAGTGPTVKMLQLIQSELGQVGISVQITLDDTTTFNNAVFAAPPPKGWNVALNIISESPDGDVAPYFMLGSLGGNAAAGGFNAGTYNNTTFNSLILQEENTTNTAQRVAILQNLAGIAHRDLPILEMYYQIEIVAYNSNIKGFQFGLGEPAYDYWGNLKPSSLAQVYWSSGTTSTTSVTSTAQSTTQSTTQSTAQSTTQSTTQPSPSPSGTNYTLYIAGAAIVVIIVAIVIAVSRRGKGGGAPPAPAGAPANALTAR